MIPMTFHFVCVLEPASNFNNVTTARSEFESDAVSVQIRQESAAAGECYRPHAERGGRGGIFSAVVDENAILRWEPFDFEQYNPANGGAAKFVMQSETALPHVTIWILRTNL